MNSSLVTLTNPVWASSQLNPIRMNPCTMNSLMTSFSPATNADSAWEIVDLKADSCPPASPPQVSDSWQHPTVLRGYDRIGDTLGVNQTQLNRAVVRPDGDEEEHVEELFGQLWVIPNPDKPKAPNPSNDGRALFWIRKELVREGRVCPDDYSPVGRGQRITGKLRSLSWA
jgi:hypothetical protein